ncbi:MAG: transporter substrate-binding domain-containing protein [Rheinheimera sp.]|nr:transporter substrate-binding domain-containing protein [Rheinheimera sp.]
MFRIGRSVALLLFGLWLSQPLAAEELLPAIPPAPAQTPCHLIAHLNESKELAAAAGLQLPRWYDLHHRLLKLLTDKAGCTLDVVGSPWPRSLALLRDGKIDLMLTMSYTFERELYADFIGPHYLEETVLVLDKQYMPKVKKLSDILLLPGAVGVLRDAWYGDEFAKASLETEFQPFLQYANSLTQKLNLLQKERVVGMLEDKTQYLEWSRTYPELAARYKIAFRLHSNPVYIVASRKGVPFTVRERLKHAWYQVYGGPEHRAILNEFGWVLE